MDTSLWLIWKAWNLWLINFVRIQPSLIIFMWGKKQNKTDTKNIYHSFQYQVPRSTVRTEWIKEKKQKKHATLYWRKSQKPMKASVVSYSQSILDWWRCSKLSATGTVVWRYYPPYIIFFQVFKHIFFVTWTCPIWEISLSSFQHKVLWFYHRISRDVLWI